MSNLPDPCSPPDRLGAAEDPMASSALDSDSQTTMGMETPPWALHRVEGLEDISHLQSCQNPRQAWVTGQEDLRLLLLETET